MVDSIVLAALATRCRRATEPVAMGGAPAVAAVVETAAAAVCGRRAAAADGAGAGAAVESRLRCSFWK